VGGRPAGGGSRGGAGAGIALIGGLIGYFAES